MLGHADFGFVRVACILLTKSPVRVGGQPCVEVAPAVMGEEPVERKSCGLAASLHSSRHLIVNELPALC